MNGINIPFIKNDSFYVKHFKNEIFEVSFIITLTYFIILGVKDRINTTA